MAINATEHYENFPVSSYLLPKHLRTPVTAIYRFARAADDIADEGTDSAEERLAKLQDFDDALKSVNNSRPVASGLATIFDALSYEHHRIGLPLAPCHALLSAFKQDIKQTRYDNYDELLNYCARSANPIGHLMLFLFGADTPQNRVESDAICTALQLTNHWQDIAIDAAKGSQGRIYLPQDDLKTWGYSDQDILTGDGLHRDPIRWAKFMRFQTNRVESLFQVGRALPARLGKESWRIGQELRLTVSGGQRILKKINAVNGDIYKHRLKLRWLDWLALMIGI